MTSEIRRIPLFRASIHKPNPGTKVLVWWRNDWYFAAWVGDRWLDRMLAEITEVLEDVEWWMPLPSSPEERA